MYTIGTYNGEVLGHAQNCALARAYADMQCAILHEIICVYEEGELIALYHPSEWGKKQTVENVGR